MRASGLGTVSGIAVLVILILLPLAAGILISEFYLSLLIRIYIFALALLGFDILLGYTGQASFGHAMFFGTGAYLTAIFLKHISTSIWLALAASITASTMLGLVIGYLCLRSRGLYFIFLTFAFGQFFYLAFNSWAFVGAADGMAGIPAPTMGLSWDMSNRTVIYYFTLAFLILGFFVARHIVNSALGRVLMGIRQNEERVSFLGYGVQRCMLASFVISAVYAGVAGCLYVGYQNFVSPSVYHWSLSGQILVMNLIGGMGTLIGPMIGSAFVIYIGDILSSWMHDTWLMVLGAIYVIFILFSPQGIAGLVLNLRLYWMTRRAA